MTTVKAQKRSSPTNDVKSLTKDSTPTDSLMAAIAMAMANFWHAERSRRIKKGLALKAATPGQRRKTIPRFERRRSQPQ